MRQFHAYAFVDGGYLRERAVQHGVSQPDPHQLALDICKRNDARSSGEQFAIYDDIALHRTSFYDGVPDDDSAIPTELTEYWEAIELLPDTHLGFGSVKRTPKGPRRQKGVDTLIAVEMLSGAYDKLFDMALLIAGDADFVPVLQEVRRRGVHLLLAAEIPTLSDELRRVCDRFVPLVRDSYRAIGGK